jgi:hypothetical protein
MKAKRLKPESKLLDSTIKQVTKYSCQADYEEISDGIRQAQFM